MIHPTAQRNALDVLRQDHRKIRDLFDTFEESEDLSEQKETVEAVIQEFRLHAQLEEQIFYPALKDVAQAHHHVDQAEEEHQDIEAVLKDLQDMDPEDPLFADKFMELEDKALEHIQEEEAELFRQAEENGLDTQILGEALVNLRQRLMQENRRSHPPSVLPPKRKHTGTRRRKL